FTPSNTERRLDEYTGYRLLGAFLEYPDARVILGAGHFVVALVCGCRRPHQHPLLSPSAYRALATGSLGARIHRDQSLSDCAPLSRATSGSALPGRTETLCPGVPLASSPRVRFTIAGGRMEE